VNTCSEDSDPALVDLLSDRRLGVPLSYPSSTSSRLRFWTEPFGRRVSNNQSL
jgi:hypothetical protein